MYFNTKAGSTAPQGSVITGNLADISSGSGGNDLATRAKQVLISYHSTSKVDFKLINELALECAEELLEYFFPNGEKRGGNYLILNPHREDNTLGSFSINLEEGYWKDFADDDTKGSDLISLIAFAFKGSQKVAALDILNFIEGQRRDNSAPVKRGAKHKTADKPTFTPVMPTVAAIKIRPCYFGPILGAPAATWTYKNAGGDVLFYVHRFDTVEGKSFRPSTYGKDESGRFLWKNIAPPVPRPAYGLDRLAARPDAPVLFTEGEKAADAGQRLFPDYVVVTTMNGAQSPEKTDFTPFSGRKIYIAPDNDEPGIAYKEKLIRLLSDAGAEVMAELCLPALMRNEQPLDKGYDLADAELSGWTATELASIGDALWKPIIILPQDTAPASSGNIQRIIPSGFLGIAVNFAIDNFNEKIVSFSNQVLGYREGYWAALDENVEIKKCLLPMIRNVSDDGNIKAGDVNHVYNLLKIEYSVMPDQFTNRSGLICLNNGTLDPITGELLSHEPAYCLTNKLDITYDLQAQCPLWLQTLDEIFAPDADKADKIQLLQEYIGYCMIPDTRMCKFLWMLGSGGNGKSLILAIIGTLIGRGNCSNAHIERFQDKFVRAELQGKLVNISSEMSASATISDSYLKQIVSGDLVEAERKYEPSFSFKPYVHIIASTNTLPRLLDHSEGFARRAIFIRFNRSFTEAEQDKNRERNLLKELPGILNWAVAGLQQLNQRGYFAIPASSEVEVAQYRINSDPVKQFAMDQLMITDDKKLYIGSELLYSQYRTWSADNGYKTLASNQFADRLTAIGYEKTKRNNGAFWNAQLYYSPDDNVVPMTNKSHSVNNYTL